MQYSSSYQMSGTAGGWQWGSGCSTEGDGSAGVEVRDRIVDNEETRSENNSGGRDGLAQKDTWHIFTAAH